MKLRLGIVGLGLIWENIHMPILMDMKEQFEIKAFCVHNEKKIPLWQQRLPGAAAYTDYRRMVQDSSVDAVVVTTPLEMNAEVTLAALEAGKDVFCEKPMAVHVDVADRIMEMEKQTGKTVYVLEQFLYNPQLPVMKKIIDGKQLGEFVSFERTTHYLMDSS
ncbi:MAG: Gfo/Idh/MocA family protein, partial [[Clostridium] leptum]